MGWESTYEKLEVIGEGTYGEVLACRHKVTGQAVAIKILKMEEEREGFPATSVREIKIQRQLSHPNLVKLVECTLCTKHMDEGSSPVSSSSSSTSSNPSKCPEIALVFEYMEHDLFGYIHKVGPLREEVGRLYTRQLLDGLSYLHGNNILHRDLKPSNVLLDNDGWLKIADFGLARQLPEDWRRYHDNWDAKGRKCGPQAQESNVCWDFHTQKQHFTPDVITLWYRPLELLFGCRQYSAAVDMWSLGCIIAEMFLAKPLFHRPSANGMMDQTLNILELCGSPEDAGWPQKMFPGWVEPAKKYSRKLKSFLIENGVPESAADLIDKLLVINPEHRLTAAQALHHPWVAITPDEAQVIREQLPRFGRCNAYGVEKKRRLERKRHEERTRREQEREMELHSDVTPQVAATCVRRKPWCGAAGNDMWQGWKQSRQNEGRDAGNQCPGTRVHRPIWGNRASEKQGPAEVQKELVSAAGSAPSHAGLGGGEHAQQASQLNASQFAAQAATNEAPDVRTMSRPVGPFTMGCAPEATVGEDASQKVKRQPKRRASKALPPKDHDGGPAARASGKSMKLGDMPPNAASQGTFPPMLVPDMLRQLTLPTSQLFSAPQAPTLQQLTNNHFSLQAALGFQPPFPTPLPLFLPQGSGLQNTATSGFPMASWPRQLQHGAAQQMPPILGNMFPPMPAGFGLSMQDVLGQFCPGNQQTFQGMDLPKNCTTTAHQPLLPVALQGACAPLQGLNPTDPVTVHVSLAFRNPCTSAAP